VGAGHLPPAGLETKTAEGIGVRARRRDLPSPHCQRGSRDLFAAAQASTLSMLIVRMPLALHYIIGNPLRRLPWPNGTGYNSAKMNGKNWSN